MIAGKIISNSGTGVVNGSDAGGDTGIEAGNRTEEYYYAGWRIIEERDGSDNTLAQTVWGIEYIDAPVRRDRNTNVGDDNDCIDSGGSAAYYYHQDANFRVVMLTDESANVVERYEYDAYGNPTVYEGGLSEFGNALPVSSVGNPFTHQGLFLDPETRTYQNRFRQYHQRLGRFMQHDPLGYADRMNFYEYVRSRPLDWLDPLGLLAQEDKVKQRALACYRETSGVRPQQRKNHKTGKMEKDPKSRSLY